MELLQKQETQKENFLRGIIHYDGKEGRKREVFFFLDEEARFYRVSKVDPGGGIRNAQNCCHQDCFNFLLKGSEYQH